MVLWSRTAEHGNVLFLILIAVALFAALSYAVLSSNRTGSGETSKERARLNAGTILNYGVALKTAMLRMTMMNDCHEDQFEFNTSFYKRNDGGAANPVNANAKSSCHPFAASADGVLPLILTNDALVTTHPDSGTPSALQMGHGAVRIMQVADIGTTGAPGTVSANDFVFIFPYLNRETCKALNDLLTVANPSNEPPVIPEAAGGTYTNGSLTSATLINDAPVRGKAAFCAWSAPRYRFYQVIVER